MSGGSNNEAVALLGIGSIELCCLVGFNSRIQGRSFLINFTKSSIVIVEYFLCSRDSSTEGCSGSLRNLEHARTHIGTIVISSISLVNLIQQSCAGSSKTRIYISNLYAINENVWVASRTITC